MAKNASNQKKTDGRIDSGTKNQVTKKTVVRNTESGRDASYSRASKITLANSEKDTSEAAKLGLKAWRKTYNNRHKA